MPNAPLPALILGPVPGLFKSHSINLMIGASLAGKTQLCLNQLNEYAEGRGFLGYGLEDVPEENPELEAEPDPKIKPRRPILPPVQLGMITADQSFDEAYESVQKFSSLKDPKKFPIAYLVIHPEETGIDALERVFLGLAGQDKIKLLFLEDIQALLTDKERATDPTTVRRLYERLRGFCLNHDVTILATVITPKMKRGEFYDRLGDRIYGGVTWGQKSSTLIGIYQEITTGGMVIAERHVQIQTRFGPPGALRADFDAEGRLRVVGDLEAAERKQEESKRDQLDSWLKNLPGGTVFTRAELDEWGEEREISERTVSRWLQERTDPTQGFLERIGKGRATKYKKPITQ